MVFAALLITGAYSVSAALGSASGGRANAATQEHAIADYRAKAQVAYETAKNELAGLAPTRPAGELRALIEGVKADPRSGGCVMLQGSMQMRCPRLAAWRVELARAERRQELAATMAKAQGDLAKAADTHQANSDAVALAGYLQTLGIECQHRSAQQVAGASRGVGGRMRRWAGARRRTLPTSPEPGNNALDQIEHHRGGPVWSKRTVAIRTRYNARRSWWFSGSRP